jgi:two-component system chemotaxis response regulator CheB
MTDARRTRILIVDDSAVMRGLLRTVVSCDTELEVVGTAVDGASALDSLQILRPDIILLDVEMPVMDGLATLRKLRQQLSRIPVIMCSSLTQRGAQVTIEALACGAADYVTKPSGQSDREIATLELARELIPKIRALTSRTRKPEPAPATGIPQTGIGPVPVVRKSSIFTPQQITSTPSIITIGVSTGGPAALDVLLPELPEHYPLPVLIVQHMPELFTRLLAQRLNGHCRLRVREASEGDPLRAGCVYIARGNWHMEMVAPSLPEGPATVHLSQGPYENHCRPSVDVLFRSAAKVYGSGVLAVVLTGMGSDGLNACRTIRDRGGTVLVQDEATSTVWGMPGSVANANLAHKVLPLELIASEILRITGQSTTLSMQLKHDHNKLAVS